MNSFYTLQCQDRPTDWTAIPTRDGYSPRTGTGGFGAFVAPPHSQALKDQTIGERFSGKPEEVERMRKKQTAEEVAKTIEALRKRQAVDAKTSDMIRKFWDDVAAKNMGWR